ncbi:MAG: hypothetical protein ACOYD1_04265 [Candidatus Nanopelagicales bacterium]
MKGIFTLITGDARAAALVDSGHVDDLPGYGQWVSGIWLDATVSAVPRPATKLIPAVAATAAAPTAIFRFMTNSPIAILLAVAVYPGTNMSKIPGLTDRIPQSHPDRTASGADLSDHGARSSVEPQFRHQVGACMSHEYRVESCWLGPVDSNDCARHRVDDWFGRREREVADPHA